jgi:tetratricopeptide (TPR) repeat protein
MIVRSNIGEVMMTLGRVPEAIQNLNDVVQAHRSLGGLTGVAGLAHVNLSRCYLALGNLAAASTHARRGKKFLREAGQAGLTAEAELQRAAVLLAQRRPDLAMVAARRGVAEARDLGALLLEARGHRIVGESLAALGKITSAEAQIKESLIIARRITATHEEAQSLMALARLSMQRNASKGHVVSTLRRAEQMLKRIGATADATEARRLLEACAA